MTKPINQNLKELQELKEKFILLKHQVAKELAQKGIDNNSIEQILKKKPNSNLDSPLNVGSRAKNRKDNPDHYKLHELISLGEFYGKVITDIVLEIERDDNKYQDFNEDLLEDLNEYINVVSLKLKELTSKKYSK